MSLFAPRNPHEAAWQRWNYGGGGSRGEPMPEKENYPKDFGDLGNVLMKREMPMSGSDKPAIMPNSKAEIPSGVPGMGGAGGLGGMFTQMGRIPGDLSGQMGQMSRGQGPNAMSTPDASMKPTLPDGLIQRMMGGVRGTSRRPEGMAGSEPYEYNTAGMSGARTGAPSRPRSLMGGLGSSFMGGDGRKQSW